MQEALQYVYASRKKYHRCPDYVCASRKRVKSRSSETCVCQWEEKKVQKSRNMGVRFRRVKSLDN
jgi:hypothetical protein